MALCITNLRQVTIAIVIVWSASCVDKGPGPAPKKIDPGYIAEHLLTTLPADVATKLDVNIGASVRYLGNRVPTGLVIPGVAFRVTHYWQVLATPDKQWRVFAHVRSADPGDFLNIDRSDMRIGHGPATWQPGEIIEDSQEITLPPGWRGKTATIFVGLFQQGKHAIADRASIKDPRAVDHALKVAELGVDLDKAPPPPGTIVVKKSALPMVIDGVASEPAWTTATVSPEFLSAEGSPDVTGTAQARMTWDDNNLYLFASVTDSDIFSEYKTNDDPLWKADCLEMFIDADGNRNGYVELQWNPNNARFDSWFATTRAQAGDVSFDSLAVSAVKVRGTADVSGDADQGWDLEVAIPWAAVTGKDANMRLRLPPRPGDRFHLNVVRVDKRGDTVTAASWSRISYSDFHALDRMLTVVFADDAVPAAAGSGEGAGLGSGAGAGVGSQGVLSVPKPGTVAPPLSPAVIPAPALAPAIVPAPALAPGRAPAPAIAPGVSAPRAKGSATILAK